MDTKILLKLIEKMISETEIFEKKKDKKTMNNILELNRQLRKELEK